MQWKLPFGQYFETESSRLSRLSTEYTPEVDEPVVKNRVEPRNRLSPQQMVVINKFPSALDTMDQNWQKMSTLLDEWKDKKQIWSLNYGLRAIAGANFLSSFYICHMCR